MPSLEQSVAQVVLENSGCARIFQKHRIDYCCKGERSVAQAASERGLDARVLLAELTDAVAERAGHDVDPRDLSNAALIGHIVARHHEYLRKALPFVQQLSAKVARVHGEHNPKLRDLEATVTAISDALGPHLVHEEEVLFAGILAGARDRAMLERELAAMHAEHLAVGALLEQLRDAAEGFTLPAWACNSYRTLFAELEALEGDVLRHVHIENHVLMPRFLS